MDFFDVTTGAAPPQQPAAPQPTGVDFFDQTTDPVGHTIRSNARLGKSWEDTAAKLKEFGVANPASQEQAFRSAAATAKYAGSQEDFLRFNLRNTLPFASAAFNVTMNERVRKARNRIQQGGADQGDYDLVASDERLRQVESQRTGTQQLAAAIAGVPRMLVETRAMAPVIGKAPALARPVAAAFAIPSMGVYEQATRSAAEDGSSPFALKNAYPAVAKAVVTAAVLGRMGQADRAFLARVPIQTAKGMIEQQAGDTALSVIDHALPEAMQTRTKYGLVGQLVNGEKGEAAQHALTQAVTFAMFAALHGRPVKPVLDAQAAVLDAAARKGQNVQQAVAQVNDFHAALSKAQAANPTATPAELAKLVPRPKGEMGRYHDSVFHEMSAVAESNEKAAPKPETPRQPQPEAPPEELASKPNLPPEPASPLGRLSKDEVAQAAKSVGLTAKQLREKQGEPWVAKLIDAVKPQVGELPTEQTPPAGQQGGATTFFRTAQGSLYAREPGGSTTRVKSQHAQVGHDAADVGIKEPSARTVYVPANVASALSTAGVQGVGKARLVLHDGKATLVTWNAKAGRWGATAAGRDVPFQESPQVGLAPLELWHPKADIPGAAEAYGKMHAGNAIVSEVPPEEGHAELRAARDAAQNAPGSTTAPEAVPPAQAADRAADATPGAGKAVLGSPEAGRERTIRGETLTRHAIYDATGAEVGDIKVFRSGDTLHVNWGSLTGAGAKDRAAKGALGTRAILDALPSIVEHYPGIVAIKYIPAEGRLRAGEERTIDVEKMLRRAGRAQPPAPAAPEPAKAPPADDPFAALAAHGLLREPAPSGREANSPPPEPAEVLKRPVVETDMGRNVGAKLAQAKTPEEREALYEHFDDLSKPDMRDALDAIGVPHKGLGRPEMKEAVRAWADSFKPKPPPPELKRSRAGDVAPATPEQLRHAALSPDAGQRAMAAELIKAQAKALGLSPKKFLAKEYPDLPADVLEPPKAAGVGQRLKDEVFRLVNAYVESGGRTGRVMPEELLREFDALPVKEKKAALAEYGRADTKRIAGKNLTAYLRKDIEARYDSPDRIRAGEEGLPAKKQPKPGHTLRRAVVTNGGLNPKGVNFLAHFASANEAREFGMKEPGFFKNGGMDLSEMAQQLHNEGHLRTPDAGELIEALKTGKESQHFYQSEDYQRQQAEAEDRRQAANEPPAERGGRLRQHAEALADKYDPDGRMRKSGHGAPIPMVELREQLPGLSRAEQDDAILQAFFRDPGAREKFRLDESPHAGEGAEARSMRENAVRVDLGPGTRPHYFTAVEVKSPPKPGRPTDLFGNPIKATPPAAKKGTQLSIEDQLREGWVDAGKAWAEEHGIEIGQWRAGGEFVDTEGRTYRVKQTEDGYKVEEVTEEAGHASFDPNEFANSDAALQIGVDDTEGQTLKGGAPFGSGTPLPRPGQSAESRTTPPGGPPQVASRPNPGAGPGETALANATVKAQNRVRAARLAFGRLWDQAQERVAAAPDALDELMDRLVSGERQTVNDLEGAMLLVRKVELLNQRDAAYRELRRVSDPAAFGSVTAEERAAASRQAQWLESLSYRLDQITQRVGTQLGRALAFRRQLVKEDYSLSNLIGRALAAKGGKPLTDAERAELTVLADEIESAGAAESAAEAAATDNPPVPQQAKGLAGRVFGPSTTLPPAAGVDVAGVRIKGKAARVKADAFISKLAERELSAPRKVIRTTGDVLNAARSILTAFDLSAVFRQGGTFTFSHPVKALRAVPEMLHSFASKEAFDRARDAIDQRENAAAYKAAGLHIADVEGPLAKQEEAFVGRWTKKIPGVAGSGRAYTAFLNRVRADWYDALAASLPAKGEPTPEESRAIAKFVNIATGRGDAKALDRTAGTLAHVFFSPRYVASRFQLLAGVPFWGGNAATRKLVAQEYGKAAVGLAVFYGIMAAANDDAKITFDPRSADFGKVVEGKSRIDPLMGLSQTMVFPSRLVSGESTNTKTGAVQPLRGRRAAPTHNAETVIWRFLRSKLAPVPGTAYDVLKGETYDRSPATAVNVAGGYVPISLQDVAKNLEDQGVPRGAVNSVLAILGMGNQVYSK
jgi:hypothetical protein